MPIYTSSFNKKPEKPEKTEKKEKKQKPEKPVKTHKKVNINWILLSIFSIVFLFCIVPHNFVKSFILGSIGLSVYPICLLGGFISVSNLLKKKYFTNKKYIAYLSVAVVVVWFIFHLILTSKISTESFGIYLKQTYLAKTTAGGVLFSLLSYPMVKFLTVVGAYIISAIVLAISIGLIVDYISVERHTSRAEKKSKFKFEEIEELNLEPSKKVETKEETAKNLAKQKLGLDTTESRIISSSMPIYDYETNLNQKKPMSKREYILTPLDPVIPPKNTNEVFKREEVKSVRPVEITPKQTYFEQKSNIQTNENTNSNEQTNIFNQTETYSQPEYDNASEEITYNQYDEEEQDIEKDIEKDDDLFVDENEMEDYTPAFETEAKLDDENDSDNFDDLEDLNEDVKSQEGIETESDNVQEININVTDNDFVDQYAYSKQEDDLGSTVDTEVVRPSVDISKFNLPNVVSKSLESETEKPIEHVEKKQIPPYVAPPVELLKYIDNPVKIDDEKLQDNIDRLEQVLEDFKVPAKVNNVQVGPAVTRYELTMPRGISVNKIAQMADDIAMTLASNGAIRVEAPIPGKTSVGIEVPNDQVTAVSLRELIDSDEFRQRGNPLSFVLGRDINGDIIFCNLDKMPHVLVAGSTGSGKSVCLNTMLLSMCYKSGPQDLRLILVDPKMVEFSTYNGLPHLLIPEVITNKNMAINALDWAIKEMERRYALFAKYHVVNINEFNKTELVKTQKEEKLPFIVIVVDELADLMLEAKREIDDRIAKLAAKARACGIHLVLATQRPSVDVITGTVKANLPSRIAFALTNYMDSKTILDGGGAEKLLGKGDMLFKPQDKPEPKRVQGAFVSSEEIQKVVDFIKENNKPVFDDDADRAIKNEKQESTGNVSSSATAERNQEFDPVLKDALRMFIQTKMASGSMISRRYAVGFNRAGRIMDQMERAGFIGPQEGSKPRKVLITMEEYNAIFGEE